nr:uncharacterized protein LOC114920232 [Labrus bergylta]
MAFSERRGRGEEEEEEEESSETGKDAGRGRRGTSGGFWGSQLLTLRSLGHFRVIRGKNPTDTHTHNRERKRERVKESESELISGRQTATHIIDPPPLSCRYLRLSELVSRTLQCAALGDVCFRSFVFLCSGLIWRAELHATRGVCKSALFFSPTSNSQLLRNTEEYSLKIVHIIGGKKAKTELSVPVLLVVHHAPITPGTSQMCSQREVVHRAQLPPETSAMCFQREVRSHSSISQLLFMSFLLTLTSPSSFYKLCSLQPRNRARGNNPLHLFIWCLKESLARNI